MINSKYLVQFKMNNKDIRMLKTSHDTTDIRSNCTLTKKKCKCSLCDNVVLLAYCTTANQINHNFCLSCVSDSFIEQHNIKELYNKRIIKKAYENIDLLIKDKSLKNLQRIHLIANKISSVVIKNNSKDYI